jgi:hypothetical protein
VIEGSTQNKRLTSGLHSREQDEEAQSSKTLEVVKVCNPHAQKELQFLDGYIENKEQVVELFDAKAKELSRLVELQDDDLSKACSQVLRQHLNASANQEPFKLNASTKLGSVFTLPQEMWIEDMD